MTARTIDGCIEAIQLETGKGNEVEKEMVDYIGNIQKNQYLNGKEITPSISLARGYLVANLLSEKRKNEEPFMAEVRMTVEGYKATLKPYNIERTERNTSVRLGLRTGNRTLAYR